MFVKAAIMLGVTSWTTAYLIDKISVGDVLVVIGAFIFYLATRNRAGQEAVRADRDDFKARKETLETDLNQMKDTVSDNQRLIRDLQSRPNLQEHADLLRSLVGVTGAMKDTLMAHDKFMNEAAARATHKDEEIIHLLREIHVAVVPPPHLRD